MIPEWDAPETTIPEAWFEGLAGVRRVGRHLPCPTTAGASLNLLWQHAAGERPFFGTVVELGEQGGSIRRLSLWEAGAAMGTVPLAWPCVEVGKWWQALGNSVPTSIPAQVLQAAYGSEAGNSTDAVGFAVEQRRRQCRSLPARLVDSRWVEEAWYAAGPGFALLASRLSQRMAEFIGGDAAKGWSRAVKAGLASAMMDNTLMESERHGKRRRKKCKRKKRRTSGRQPFFKSSVRARCPKKCACLWMQQAFYPLSFIGMRSSWLGLEAPRREPQPSHFPSSTEEALKALRLATRRCGSTRGASALPKVSAICGRLEPAQEGKQRQQDARATLPPRCRALVRRRQQGSQRGRRPAGLQSWGLCVVVCLVFGLVTCANLFWPRGGSPPRVSKCCECHLLDVVVVRAQAWETGGGFTAAVLVLSGHCPSTHRILSRCCTSEA